MNVIKMDFPETLYVEITLNGEIAEIYEETKQYLEKKEFIFKNETPNKLLNALYMDKKLGRNLDVTLEPTKKGILVIINDAFESSKVRGEIFTLRQDVNALVTFLKSKFTYVE